MTPPKQPAKPVVDALMYENANANTFVSTKDMLSMVQQTCSDDIRWGSEVKYDGFSGKDGAVSYNFSVNEGHHVSRKISFVTKDGGANFKVVDTGDLIPNGKKDEYGNPAYSFRPSYTIKGETLATAKADSQTVQPQVAFYDEKLRMKPSLHDVLQNGYNKTMNDLAGKEGMAQYEQNLQQEKEKENIQKAVKDAKLGLGSLKGVNVAHVENTTNPLLGKAGPAVAEGGRGTPI